MKLSIVLAMCSLAACLLPSCVTTPEEKKVNLVTLHIQATQYVNSADPDLGRRFYPLPSSFDADKYTVEVFPDYIRYTHNIRHFALTSPISAYNKNADASEDEIARRYRAFVLNRNHALHVQSKMVNQLITRYVKVKKPANHFVRSNLDVALIEYSSAGEPISMLVRANVFNTSANLEQIVNTYQTQQSFIIFGPRVKTIAHKLRHHLKTRTP